MRKKCKSKLDFSVGMQKIRIERIVRDDDGKPRSPDQFGGARLVLFVQTGKRFVEQNDVL